LGRRRAPFKTATVSFRLAERFLREMEKIALSEGYTDIGDYIRNLIRKDFKERGITAKLEKELEERLKEEEEKTEEKVEEEENDEDASCGSETRAR